MAERTRVGLVGVTGYTGMELCRLLAAHPDLELAAATSRAEAGRTLAELYPFLTGTPMADLAVTEPDPVALARDCRVVFLAVPHKTAQHLARAIVDAGSKVVDLSADFRLRDPETYEQWYATPHSQRPLLDEAVYGLPEFYAEAIGRARLVANPGCYPTSAILGLAPALAAGLVEPDGLVVDSKSGVSGAGRGANVGTLFCEVHDSFKAYNLGKHRHTPEIEQELSRVADAGLTLVFSPHLVPMDRGILTTSYARLKRAVDADAAQAAYEDFYKGHRFVRVLPQGTLPETRWVRGTVHCDVGVVVEPRTGRLIAVSAIDNLCRGASGQAVMNANLMLGLELGRGLNSAPMMP